jgi:ABC-type nitrate/sulfonate/bicarbonate transport system substrate-binding protein
MMMTSLALAAAARPAALRAQAKSKINVAFPIVDPTAEVLYAYEMGFFDRAGLDVTLTPLSNGAAIAAGVISGAIDFGIGNVLTIEAAFKKGIPLTIVAPAAINVDSAPSNVLMVAKTSPLKTARDLNGKVVSINPLRGIGELMASAWIDKNGGDSTTVRFIELPFQQSEAALAQGRADAATGVEPFITQSRTTTRVFANTYAVLGENYLITAFFAASAWAQAHPDVVSRFASAIRETANWANKNTDKSAEILAKYSKLDLDLVKQTVRAVYAPALTPAQLQPTIDAAVRYKLIDGAFRAQDVIFQPK